MPHHILPLYWSAVIKKTCSQTYMMYYHVLTILTGMLQSLYVNGSSHMPMMFGVMVSPYGKYSVMGTPLSLTLKSSIEWG